jgi:hypothetical protein
MLYRNCITDKKNQGQYRYVSSGISFFAKETLLIDLFTYKSYFLAI